MADSFIFVCPFCGQKLDVPAECENMALNCPTCGKEIVPARDSFPESNEVKKNTEKQNPEPQKADGEKSFKDKFKRIAGIDRPAEKQDAGNKTSSSRAVIYTRDDGSFKSPLLYLLYRCIGLFWTVIFLLLCVGFTICLIMNYELTKTHSIIEIICVLVSPLVLAIINFGIAQIIYCICRTAYNTDRLVELMSEKK